MTKKRRISINQNLASVALKQHFNFRNIQQLFFIFAIRKYDPDRNLGIREIELVRKGETEYERVLTRLCVYVCVCVYLWG